MNLRALVPFRDRPNGPRNEVGMFGSLHREIDRLFDDFARPLAAFGGASLVPQMDVVETDTEIEITTELPGLERKDVEISVDNNVLTIRGEKKAEMEAGDKEKKEDNKSYRLAERTYGMFYRVLELPMSIDVSTVQATMSNGILKVKIPKPARPQAKKIEIKEAA